MGSIVINFNGKKFILEYNRKSITTMEAKGFKINELEDKPLTTVDLLISGAFYKNHKDITDEEIEDIISNIDDYEGFVKALVELYVKALNSIMGANEDKPKNATWGRA